MKDIVCLVADKNMEAAMAGLFSRSQALRTRPIKADLLVHPQRDPGCFHQAADLLKTFQASHDHALVVIDRAWDGAPAKNGLELEALLQQRLDGAGIASWAAAIVIDPELEAWVFSDSPQVDDCLGWTGRAPTLRSWLAARGLWLDGIAKPPDPKKAVALALYQVRKPRSSAIYRELAEKVGLDRCVDPSFARLRALLQEWFPPER